MPAEILPLPQAETLEDTAAYVEEQHRLSRRSAIFAGAGIFLGILGIPFAIIGSLAVGSPLIAGNILRVVLTLPLTGALILLVTGGILLLDRYALLRRIAKSALLYLFYLAAVLVVFQMASVYNFGDIPTPMVAARLILFPAGLWAVNLALLWFLKRQQS